ncbi:hypothetical protein B5F44_03975 [Gordonibacter urolithinfaciens]|nr:hypothetical protein B5F44_03975 [Gordonibacter urolithinfaciens]
MWEDYMADLGKIIKQGLDDAGREIGKAAEGFGAKAGEAVEFVGDKAGEAAGFVGSKAGEAAGFVGEHLVDLRDKSGEAIKGAGEGIAGIIGGIVNHDKCDEEGSDDNNGKKAEEYDEYEVAIVDYNQAYTDMSDAGVMLHQERERSGDLLAFVETLVNSIANTPKDFQQTFEEIRIERENFTAAEQYAKEELAAARQSAMSSAGGIAAGAAVASMAPTAAMWIATTFGTASTGAAISTLSGAAASQAALAWLGGGALAAGGSGVAGGSALLALAGPVGWGLAGATLLTSIILFARKSFMLKQQKHEELMDIKQNTAKVQGLCASITSVLDKTRELRENLQSQLQGSLRFYGCDYTTLNESDKGELAALVNNSKSLGKLMTEEIGQAE